MTAGKNKQTGNDLQYQVLRGSSGNMKVIKAGEVDLVVTSPPYFPDEIEPLLRKPLAEQNDYERIEKAITEFALSLRLSFEEGKRVLKLGGALVVQTKDIRYGQFLVPLIELHLDLAVSSGFRLVSRIHWLSTPGSRTRLPKFSQSRRRGEFRVRRSRDQGDLPRPPFRSCPSKVPQRDTPASAHRVDRDGRG